MTKAAISLTFDLRCKAIAALFISLHIVVLFEDIAVQELEITLWKEP